MLNLSQTPDDVCVSKIAIFGTSAQLDNIWRHKKDWKLILNWDQTQYNHEIEYAMEGKKRKIVVILENPVIINRMEVNFRTFTRKADFVLNPLKTNGMSIKDDKGIFTIPKKQIHIDQG